jgi:hypothetical protein
MRAAAFAPAFACTTESAPPADSATTGDTAAVVVHADSIRAPSAAAMTVTPRGVGALQAGMTIAEARAAVGSKLVVPAGTDTTACGWLQWVDGPQGVAVMIDSGRVARIDVREGAMATSEGARVGDTEERVNTLYAGRVATTPH